MIATAMKLNTISWVVTDCKMMSTFIVSTEAVKKDCKKPIMKAFLELMKFLG